MMYNNAKRTTLDGVFSFGHSGHVRTVWKLVGSDLRHTPVRSERNHKLQMSPGHA